MRMTFSELMIKKEIMCRKKEFKTVIKFNTGQIQKNKTKLTFNYMSNKHIE